MTYGGGCTPWTAQAQPATMGRWFGPPPGNQWYRVPPPPDIRTATSRAPVTTRAVAALYRCACGVGASTECPPTGWAPSPPTLRRPRPCRPGHPGGLITVPLKTPDRLRTEGVPQEWLDELMAWRCPDCSTPAVSAQHGGHVWIPVALHDRSCPVRGGGGPYRSRPRTCRRGLVGGGSGSKKNGGGFVVWVCVLVLSWATRTSALAARCSQFLPSL